MVNNSRQCVICSGNGLFNSIITEGRLHDVCNRCWAGLRPAIASSIAKLFKGLNANSGITDKCCRKSVVKTVDLVKETFRAPIFRACSTLRSAATFDIQQAEDAARD